MGVAGVSRRKGTRTPRRNDRLRSAASRKLSAGSKPMHPTASGLPTWAGFVFLAVVVDAFSRRVVGWQVAHHLRTELVIEALNMALWQRRPGSVVHHSDQGSQYTSYAFGKRCREG